MTLVVQKYGGTSVADLERIRHVAARVARDVRAGERVCVVLSAMAGETNKLVGWVDGLDPAGYDPAEYDVVVSSGEQVTVGLGDRPAVDRRAGPLVHRLAGRWRPMRRMARRGSPGSTRPPSWRPSRPARSPSSPASRAGPGDRLATLGRGGSDTSAVALAAAIGADRCDIFTDVDGVYTSDPRIVTKARKLDRITYEEMLELASQGAKVLQTRSVALAMAHKVKVQVLSSFSDEPGTLVVDEDDIVEQQVVSGIAYSRDEARLTVLGVRDRPGIAAAVFGPLAAAGINVDMIVQSVSRDGVNANMTFTVTRSDLKRAQAVLAEHKSSIGFGEILADDDVSKVSVIGVGMRSHAGIAHTMFQTLADKGINIQAISTSEIKVSVLIDEAYTELALRALHTAYGLDGS